MSDGEREDNEIDEREEERNDGFKSTKYTKERETKKMIKQDWVRREEINEK